MPYVIISCLAVIAAGLLVWINYGFKISRHTLEYENLPQEFDGFKIALISDLHDATFGQNNSRLVAALESLSPDIVTMAGDMHTFSCYDDEYLPFLSRLCKTLPVYGVEGNHDWQKVDVPHRAPYIEKHLSTGITDLSGNSRIITKNGASILLYGAGYGEYPPSECESKGDLFSIALIHVPDWFDKIKNKPDLMLSGHVHGGILRIPFVGGFLAPGYGATILERFKRQYFFPKYSKGIYRQGPHCLAVSVGLGKASIQPFRFLRPEIMLLTLKKANKEQ